MSLFGELAGSILGFAGNESTNSTNERMNEANNALKYKMFQEGNDFTNSQRIAQNEFSNQQRIAQNEQAEKMLGLEQDFTSQMWQKQADYNSEVAQAQRLREAGLNPALVMSASSNGTGLGGSPSGSVPSASVPSAGSSVGVPNVEPTRYTNSFASAADMANLFADIEAKSIDNVTRGVKNLAEINDLKASASDKNERANMTNLEARAYEQAFGNIVASYAANNQLTMAKVAQANANVVALGAQAEMMATNKNLTQKELDYFDKDKLVYYANMAAELSLKGSQLGVNRAMAQNYIASAMLADAQRNGVNLNNTLIRRTTNYIVNKAFYEAKSAQSSYLGSQRWDNDFTNWWIKTANSILTPVGANLNFGQFLKK